MEHIIEELWEMDRVQFPNKSYISLTEYIHDLTRYYKLPFSADHTEMYKQTATYTCTFGGRCRSQNISKTNTGCRAVLYFTKEFIDDPILYSFDIDRSKFEHNHSLNSHFIEAHRNCLTKDQIEEIIYQTKVGVLPGRIRTNTDASNIGSQIFYNIKRNQLKESKQENLQELIDLLEKNNENQTIIHLRNEILFGLTVLHLDVSVKEYASDICIIDDTCLTNIYGLPLEMIISIDSEDHTQILSYGFFENKTTESFVQFFEDFKKLGGNQFRVAIVDRLQAQISALEQSFPNTFIAFCLIHLRRDLVRYFGANSLIVRYFDQTKFQPELSDQYLTFLQKTLSEMEKDTPGYHMISNLIQQSEHWLPINLIIHGIYTNMDSSRIEGLFGLFKSNYGHERGQLKSVIKNINNQSSVLLTQSYYSRATTDRLYPLFPMVYAEEKMYFGKLFFNLMSIEYYAFIWKNEKTACVLCTLRDQGNELALPCRHTITNETKTNVSDVHPRFLRIDKIIQKIQKPLTIEVHDPKNNQFKYSDLMAQISPFAAIASKNTDVAEAFETFMQKLNDLKIEINKGMPTTIPESGRLATIASKNVVLGGKPKLKQTRHCKNCGALDHDKRNCPFK